MEYMEKGSLKLLDQSTGRMLPMPERLARRYIIQVLAGLRYSCVLWCSFYVSSCFPLSHTHTGRTVHDNSIIHRDIKPDNLLVAQDETVKISDFGVSRTFEGSDLMKMNVGTPMFWAPEAIGGGEVSGRACDIWALGVSLYIMLFARYPWQVDGDEVSYRIGQQIAHCPLRQCHVRFCFTHTLHFLKFACVCRVEYPPDMVTELALDFLNKTLTKDPQERATMDMLLVRCCWLLFFPRRNFAPTD